MILQVRFYTKATTELLGFKAGHRAVSVPMDYSRIVGKPEVIDRCCLVVEGGGMVIQFAPEGLQSLGSMSVDRIYIEGSALVIHKADPAVKQERRSCCCDDHAKMRESDGLAGKAWGSALGVM
ncbi:hypothetical protein AO726_02595 [Pseudomonas sp. TTU2014-080ASC]|nr:hypothetical protein AO726_02595 [Pseudomonas sp. TTU2014-080ASC]